MSGRLVDSIVAHQDAATIAVKVREHLADGTDHVIVISNDTDLADGVDRMEQLASAPVNFPN